MTTNFETGNQPVTVRRRPPPPQPTVNIFHPPTIILCCGSLSADSLHSKKRRENYRSSDRGQSVQSIHTMHDADDGMCKEVWTYAKLDSFSRASFFYSYKLERSLLLLPSIVNWSCSSGLSDYLQPIAAINDALQSGSEVIKMVFQKRKRRWRRRSRMNEFKSHHHHHQHHRSQLNCETRRWSSTSSSCWMPTYKCTSVLSSLLLSLGTTHRVQQQQCSTTCRQESPSFHCHLPTTAPSSSTLSSSSSNTRCTSALVSFRRSASTSCAHAFCIHTYIYINRRHRLLRSIGHAVWVWETIWDLQSVDLYSPFSGMAANLYVVHVHINFRSDSVLVGRGETRT